MFSRLEYSRSFFSRETARGQTYVDTLLIEHYIENTATIESNMLEILTIDFVIDIRYALVENVVVNIYIDNNIEHTQETAEILSIRAPPEIEIIALAIIDEILYSDFYVEVNTEKDATAYFYYFINCLIENNIQHTQDMVEVLHSDCIMESNVNHYQDMHYGIDTPQTSLISNYSRKFFGRLNLAEFYKHSLINVFIENSVSDGWLVSEIIDLDIVIDNTLIETDTWRYLINVIIQDNSFDNHHAKEVLHIDCIIDNSIDEQFTHIEICDINVIVGERWLEFDTWKLNIDIYIDNNIEHIQETSEIAYINVIVKTSAEKIIKRTCYKQIMLQSSVIERITLQSSVTKQIILKADCKK